MSVHANLRGTGSDRSGRRRTGEVWLIGAGPGAADLLTLRAVRLIQRAEVIVYDHLADADCLDFAGPGAELICVGKRAGCHSTSQAAINAVLLARAKAGQCVVRLKGGDPGIFGRAGEEIEHLAQHGIRVGIVPGVTAALGCAAALGIPLTHRGIVRSLHLVTGHCRSGEALDLDWPRLADPAGTTALYMGRHNLSLLAARLIEAGLPARTPAVAVENGTLPSERRIFASIARLPQAVRTQAGNGPLLVIVGDVVALAPDWTTGRLVDLALAQHSSA